MSDPKNEQPEVEDSPETNPEDHPTTMDAEVDLPAAEEPALAESDDEPTVVDLKVKSRVSSAPAEPDAAAESDEAQAPVASAPATPVSTPPAKKDEPRRKWKPKPKTGLKPLGPYAVIETGGKQYRVSVGDRVSVEKLPAEAGSSISLDRVLLLAGDGTARVGTPIVDGATVEATVDDHYRGDKIVVFKYKPKKRYRRRQGHRQSLTHLTITAINA